MPTPPTTLPCLWAPLTTGIHSLPRIRAAASQPAAEGGEGLLDVALVQLAVAMAHITAHPPNTSSSRDVHCDLC